MNDKPCPNCGATNWIGKEYDHECPEHYDGVSEWECMSCKTRYGRWSNKILGSNELEKRDEQYK